MIFKNLSQLIREVAAESQLPEETVKKIVYGYYSSISSKYMNDRFSEFRDKWFAYRLNHAGRKKFLSLVSANLKAYDRRRKERIVLKKIHVYYNVFIKYLKENLNV